MVSKKGFTMKMIFCNTGEFREFEARQIIAGEAKDIWVDTEETPITDISSSIIFSFPWTPTL